MRVPAFLLVLVGGVAGAALGLGKGPRSNRSHRPPRPSFDAAAHVAKVRMPAPVRARRLPLFIALALVLLMGAGVYAAYEFKSAKDTRLRAIALTGGDPDLGRDLTKRYGCAGCHTIPGVPGAQGQVGPSLEGFSARIYIGGVATNSPDILMQWIENPKAIDPKTAMPITGISREEARHVAAYLYTLR